MTPGRLELLKQQLAQTMLTCFTLKSQADAGLKQNGVEDTLRWRMEIAGEDAGSDSDSEDENMVEGEVSLEELNRHVSSEEQCVTWPRLLKEEQSMLCSTRARPASQMAAARLSM